MIALEVKFLQRLVADRPDNRRNEGVAASMEATEGLGRARGARVFYEAPDFEKAANILITRGFEVQARLEPFIRSDAPAGGSEKAGALAVTLGLLACRGIGMDLPLKVSRDGFCALSSADAMRLDHEAILVIENLEPLIRLDTYEWLHEFYKGRKVLAIFRGSTTWFSTRAAADFIKASSLPTLAFFDFDPKGLSMAASLPKREILCLPALDELEIKAKKMGRQNLFTQSVHTSRAHLDSVTDPEISAAWKMMKRITLGLNQEQF